jgi:hypothetical protein
MRRLGVVLLVSVACRSEIEETLQDPFMRYLGTASPIEV